jgi:hypothetical protein
MRQQHLNNKINFFIFLYSSNSFKINDFVHNLTFSLFHGLRKSQSYCYLVKGIDFCGACHDYVLLIRNLYNNNY